MRRFLVIAALMLLATSAASAQDQGGNKGSQDQQKNAKPDPKMYDSYVGEYAVNERVAIFITKDGDKLMGQAAGRPKVELVPESETKFVIKEANVQIEFVKGDDEKVTHLLFREGGREMQAKKVK